MIELTKTRCSWDYQRRMENVVELKNHRLFIPRPRREGSAPYNYSSNPHGVISVCVARVEQDEEYNRANCTSSKFIGELLPKLTIS